MVSASPSFPISSSRLMTFITSTRQVIVVFRYVTHPRSILLSLTLLILPFQLGGSDQWGNITAGTELISKMTSPSSNSSPLKEGGGEAYGLTTPLLTTSKGEKFGKSAGNAIWLDPHLTPVFEFYQYFIRIADDDVRSLLLRLTMLPLDEIDRVMHQHHSAPEARIAQRCLAREMTELIHSGKSLS